MITSFSYAIDTIVKEYSLLLYYTVKPYMQSLATFSEMWCRNLRSEILYKCVYVCKWVVHLKVTTSILQCFSLTLQTFQASQPMCHSCFSWGEPSETVKISSQFSIFKLSFNSLVSQTQPTPVRFAFSITHREGRVWWCSMGFRACGLH